MDAHDFIIGPTDTDSISFCKADQSPFSEEELVSLLNEINDISPEFIEFENDGYYKSCLVLKAKNYVLWDGKTKSIKGSSMKTSSKEPALAKMMQEIIDVLIADEVENSTQRILKIYHDYVKEVLDLKDISRWSKKTSASESVLNCKGYEKYTKEQLKVKGIRANETNVWDAIKNEELVQQGDRYYLYPTINIAEIETKTLKNGIVKEKHVYSYGLTQAKAWDGKNHDVEQLLKRLHDTLNIFKTVLNIDEFLNYSLKRNKDILKNNLTN